MDTKKLDSKYFGRNNSPMDIELTGAEGSYLIDVSGKKYIDFLMGWSVGNLGWGNKEIKNAIKNSQGPAYVYPDFLYRPWAELAEMLAGIAPGKLKRTFRTTGGTESVDAAMQIAMCYTGRRKFMSIEGCYHGNSIGTLSIGASENRDQYNLLSGCYKLSPPLDLKAAGRVETRLKNEDIAAFIMEPVICNLGVLIPDEEFMYELQGICKRYGTLLIMDEVATGFGRTGKLFGSQLYGLSPDIMTLGKAITGGYAGMGAIMVTEKIYKAIKDRFSLYSTYGWHPLSVDAALANIGYMKQNQESLMLHVAEMSELFRERLLSMKFKKEATVHIAGLTIGVDFEDAEYAEKVQKKCRKNGLLLGTVDTGIIIFPALNIDADTAREGLDLLEKSI